jgi:mRNA interferase RelE/StbE
MARQQQYILKVTNETVDLIRGLHPTIKSVIRSALKTILAEPYTGKPLKDDLKGLRSFRIKRYRIIYRILPSKKQLEIVAIGPRKNIYEETFRLIRKEQKS